MDAAAEAGFGEVSGDLEDDFAAFLAPKKPRTGAEADTKPAKKTAGRRRQRVTPSSQDAPGAPQGAQSADSAAEATQAASEPLSAAERPSRARGGRPAKGDGPKPLVLLTPVEIRTRMQRERSESGKKYADQVLDALEATVDELPELIAAVDRPQTVKGSLFERVVEDKHDVVKIQLTIPGLAASHIAVIDDLVVSTGAQSRSKLVNTALDNYLPR